MLMPLSEKIRLFFRLHLLKLFLMLLKKDKTTLVLNKMNQSHRVSVYLSKQIKSKSEHMLFKNLKSGR
ncbi:hypothetical protein AUR66_18610 [Haloferax profundi]|uniref:Uncharacterized protein n=1 Tax=Haloferax profundi TaxID=1544718 RepID=A0A0W1RSX5_9EURY|nr:hypothetical protein AUR66_18610 [Haloferax profundi]